MTIVIKQWRNNTASLMLDSGEILWTFSRVSEAEQACQHWMQTLQLNRKRHHLAPLPMYERQNPPLIR